MVQGVIFAWVSIFILTCGLWASTVTQVSIQEMVHESEFVFEGKVVRSEAVRSSSNGAKNILTRVTFAILDVLKGSYDESTVSLYFMGGTIGPLTLSISHMQIPKNGERGIYFVESMANRQVHPLYGWNQGRFLILNDRDGASRVHTAQGKLIAALDALEQTETRATPMIVDGATGSALGLKVAADSSGSEIGLTPAAFKRRIREIGGLR